MLLLRNSLCTGLLLLLIGCASIDNNSNFNEIENLFLKNKVKTTLSTSFQKNKPECIAILPFQFDKAYVSNIENINIQELVRKTFYAHISPLQYRDIELSKVDYYLNKNDDLKTLGKNINCQNFITGRIKSFEKKDLKVYSNISIEVDIELHNTSELNPIWKSSHSINTHGGSIPLSPIGLAIGIIDAAKNLEEQQYVRITDELVREIVNTFPDNEEILIANSFENLETFSDINKTKISANNVMETTTSLLDGSLPSNEYAQSLYDDLKYDDSYNVIQTLIQNDAANHDTFFLKGRIELKLNLLQEAEQSFIKSAALNNKEPITMNALAYVYSINDKPFKAEAAYKMSIQTDFDNIFAHKNLGILMIKTNRSAEALYFLDTAAVTALKTGQFHEYKSILTLIQSMKNTNNDVLLSIENLKLLEKKLLQEI